MFRKYFKSHGKILKAASFIVCMVICGLLCMQGLLSSEESRDNPNGIVHVLYINSYHPGYTWSDQVYNGMREVLQSHYHTHLDLTVEYLDAKRHGKKLRGELGRHVRNSWYLKYRDNKPDIIFVSDQDGYDFLRTVRRDIFPGVPVVFSGVEDPGQLDPFTTGVISSTDYRGNIDIITQVRPDCGHIWVITDDSVTGRLNEQLLLDSIAGDKSIPPLVFIPGNAEKTTEDVLARVRSIPRDDAVLFLVYTNSPEGKYVNMTDFLSDLCSVSPVPVFSHVNLYMDYGVTGGSMNSGYLQGRQVAGMGIKILSGTPASALKPEREVSRPMFTYSSLLRYSIDESLLPGGSIIEGKPEDFFRRYGAYVVGILLFIVFQTFLIVLLFIFYRRQQQLRRMTRESEERYAAAVSATSDAIWEWDLLTNRTYYSPRWYEMLGYNDREFEMTFESWVRLCHPDDLEKTLASIQSTVKSPGAVMYNTEFRMRHSDGSWRWIRARGNVTRQDREGKPVIFSGTNTDITGEKKAGEMRRRLEEQLLQNQKIESVGRLAGGVAHDFNNLIGVILGYTELALKRVDPGDKLHMQITQIRRAAERSADLTKQLLAFSRQQPVAPRVIDLNKTIASMLKLLQRLIGEDIDLVWKPMPDLWLIKIDHSQVDQVLANLCINARDAIAGNGRIVIKTENVSVDDKYGLPQAGQAAGDYVKLVVEDNGCGMDEETRTRLFEPFFTTKPVGEGTGLGLATVYGIVSQNNGFINVYSEPGRGSSFRIYLPRTCEGESDQLERSAVCIEPGQGETILLVEDDQRMLDVTRDMLEQLGYMVIAAQTPGDALRAAAENREGVDLVLTDVIMPEINGRGLYEGIREIIPEVPCIFMSGYTADIISTHGILDEGIDFIEKPFTLESLAREVRRVLCRDS